MAMTTKLVFFIMLGLTQLRVGELKSGRPLRIAIPDAIFQPFVEVQNNKFSGFSIEVFMEAWKLANINSPYEFVLFNGTYNELVESVGRKEFDAAVGDLQILGHRLRTADFTIPYLASGITIVVPQKEAKFKATWILDVFSIDMWFIIVAMHLSISLVVAVIELSDKEDTFDFKTLFRLWLSLLSFSERDPLESDVGRYVRAVWKLVIAVLVACYYANLTSSLTASKLIPGIPETGNVHVGCNKNSFICNNYLRDVLHIDPKKIKTISSIAGYVDAFKKSEIQAAYFIEPHARVFLKMHGNKFIDWGTSHHLGGLGFVFPKDSPYTSDVSVAISEMLENGRMEILEKKMIDSLPRKEISEDGDLKKIHPSEFSGLLIVSAIGLTLGSLVVVKRMISKGLIPLLPLQNNLRIFSIL